MKINLVLLLMAALCFVLAACATGPQTGAVVAAATASAVALIDALAPLLSPEDLARLQVTAAGIDGTVAATAKAVSTIADAITNLRSGTGGEIAKLAADLQSNAVMLADRPGREELYLVSGGAASAGTAASRILSHLKHKGGA